MRSESRSGPVVFWPDLSSCHYAKPTTLPTIQNSVLSNGIGLWSDGISKQSINSWETSSSFNQTGVRQIIRSMILLCKMLWKGSTWRNGSSNLANKENDHFFLKIYELSYQKNIRRFLYYEFRLKETIFFVDHILRVPVFIRNKNVWKNRITVLGFWKVYIGYRAISLGCQLFIIGVFKCFLRDSKRGSRQRFSKMFQVNNSQWLH